MALNISVIAENTKQIPAAFNGWLTFLSCSILNFFDPV